MHNILCLRDCMLRITRKLTTLSGLMYRLYNEDEGLSNIHDRRQSLRTCILNDPNAEAFPFPIGSS